MEKQTMNAIKSIYKFNLECKRPDGSCLLDQGYDDAKESAFSIEEMLEGFSNLHILAAQVMAENEEHGYYNYTAKDISRGIIGLARMDGDVTESITDVDRLDKHLDSIVYNFGSIFKLGLSPQQALKALSIVCDANLTKLSAGQDEHGKQRKPVDFVPPEQRLQLILDEREPKC
jgi:hypothetical protein